MLHLIWSVIVGFFCGLIARALLPGVDHMGFIATTLVGIVGSVVGGLIGNAISRPAPGASFHPAGFLMSIVGAMVLLLVLPDVAVARVQNVTPRPKCQRGLLDPSLGQATSRPARTTVAVKKTPPPMPRSKCWSESFCADA